MTKHEAIIISGKRAFVIRPSPLFRHSSFVIRHFPNRNRSQGFLP